MRRLFALMLGLSTLALGGGNGGSGPPAQPTLTGDLQIHDPTVLEVGGRYVAMGTGFENIDGGTLRIKTSADGLRWSDAGTLGTAQPAWVAKQLGTQPPNLWAPTLSRRGSTTYLYYAASLFGKNTSGIGLATNPHLDPAHPAAGWTDQGAVLTSKRGDTFNAIDPFRIDTNDGRAWLAFGSFWDGIKLRELDAVSGKLRPGNSTLYSLASRGGGAVEAASLLEHGGYFYLFVSFDRCCAGLDSTYHIMVGRAKQITGPYTDREGVPMMKGGGSQLQASSGRLIGPGGQEVYRNGAQDWLVYHYYDGDLGGTPQLQTAQIGFDAAGWPVLGALPK
ncbi:arabinan endo-1,5-alpha-L-arabinosidase [Deinococcus ruber]|uniref:Arabinan endo-1,5-alpha-L-arabinosidase n=1 Tax=Deinococcus ruber TaxID=1848197 RepID=A0A918CDP8_9DEIO|nr:arabinan endo-1,5-alpha-L-arabinosidase [Deinococcus ruber]GGR18886.1 arabinan endo-1,5-alpha-L-arabinosidase [Deinococcus ruber]